MKPFSEMSYDESQAWLAHMFETEYCAECGGDAGDHDCTPDVMGLPHATCRFPLSDDPDSAEEILELRKVRREAGIPITDEHGITPGDWEAGIDGMGSPGVFDALGNHLLNGEGNDVPFAEREINAALMSAEPKMLRALIAALPYLELLAESNEEDGEGACSEAIAMVEDAIATFRKEI